MISAILIILAVASVAHDFIMGDFEHWLVFFTFGVLIWYLVS